MLDVTGVRLHVRERGPKNAPAVILLHGFGAILIGNSIGGRIAWTSAARHTERVDKPVLVSPDGFASPRFGYVKAPAVPAVPALMRCVLPRPVLRMNLAPAYADTSVLTDALETRYHDPMRAPGARAAMFARIAQTVLVDLPPLLRTIRAPMLLVWGERDARNPFANSADHLQAPPTAQRVALPGVGHLPQEEAPECALAATKAFLQQRRQQRVQQARAACRAVGIG